MLLCVNICRADLLQEPIVLFFDELPWMDTPKSNFIAAFSYFWNSWASMVPQLKLIVCGSSTTWMLAKFIGDQGGIWCGRVTRQIYLAPFSLGETELFLNELKGLALTRQQVLDVYMILGGIPYYLDMLERGVPLDVCIDRPFFSGRIRHYVENSISSSVPSLMTPSIIAR